MDTTKKHQKNNFTMVSNIVRNDDKLSLKAKGLIFYLMGLPDNWAICIKELCRHSADGETAVRGAVAELIKGGYMKMTKKRNERGLIEGTLWEYSDEPIFLADSDEPNVDKPNAENPYLENPNVDKPNTENLNVYNIYNNNIDLNNTLGNNNCAVENFSTADTQPTDENLSKNQDEEKKESSAKERKTLCANSDYYKKLKGSDDEETTKRLEECYKDLAEQNVDIFYYFKAMELWSDSSNTKRTSRGWKSTLREFVRRAKEKGNLKVKIKQQKKDLFDDYKLFSQI